MSPIDNGYRIRQKLYTHICLITIPKLQDMMIMSSKQCIANSVERVAKKWWQGDLYCCIVGKANAVRALARTVVGRVSARIHSGGARGERSRPSVIGGAPLTADVTATTALRTRARGCIETST